MIFLRLLDLEGIDSVVEEVGGLVVAAVAATISVSTAYCRAVVLVAVLWRPLRPAGEGCGCQAEPSCSRSEIIRRLTVMTVVRPTTAFGLCRFMAEALPLRMFPEMAIL